MHIHDIVYSMNVFIDTSALWHTNFAWVLGVHGSKKAITTLTIGKKFYMIYIIFYEG